MAARLGVWHLGSALTGWVNLEDYHTLIVSQDGIADVIGQPGTTYIVNNSHRVTNAYTEGLSYATALANGWLLDDIGGGYFTLDLSIPACVTALASGVRDYALASGLDGVFLDETTPVPAAGPSNPPGWKAGMQDLVQAVGDYMVTNNLKMLCNMNGYGAVEYGDWNNGEADINWVADTPGFFGHKVMIEFWQTTREGNHTKRLTGVNWYELWDEWQAVPAALEALDVGVVCLSFVAANWDYCYASMLDATSTGIFIAAQGDFSDPAYGPFSPTSWTINSTTGVGTVTQEDVTQQLVARHLGSGAGW